MHSSDEHALSLFADSISYAYPAALRVAAHLAIADQLADGPSSVDDIAARCGVDSASLLRTLRVLVTRGVFTEATPHTFAITDRAQPLRTEHPTTVRHAILAHTDPAMWRATGELTTAVRDGTPSFNDIFGQDLFGWYTENPDDLRSFQHAMADLTGLENQPAVAVADLPSEGTIVDVGGGTGGLLTAALHAYPGLYGILYDQAEVLAEHQIDDAALAGRWETHPGNFFDQVPGADVYLLKRITHDWNDELNTQILGNCAHAGGSGARIVVIDATIPEGDTPHGAKLLDLILMGITPGRERTAAEFQHLFTAAGIRLDQIQPLPTTMLSAVIGTVQ